MTPRLEGYLTGYMRKEASGYAAAPSASANWDQKGEWNLNEANKRAMGQTETEKYIAQRNAGMGADVNKVRQLTDQNTPRTGTPHLRSEYGQGEFGSKWNPNSAAADQRYAVAERNAGPGKFAGGNFGQETSTPDQGPMPSQAPQNAMQRQQAAQQKQQAAQAKWKADVAAKAQADQTQVGPTGTTNAQWAQEEMRNMNEQAAAQREQRSLITKTSPGDRQRLLTDAYTKAQQAGLHPEQMKNGLVNPTDAQRSAYQNWVSAHGGSKQAQQWLAKNAPASPGQEGERSQWANTDSGVYQDHTDAKGRQGFEGKYGTVTMGRAKPPPAPKPQMAQPKPAQRPTAGLPPPPTTPKYPGNA